MAKDERDFVKEAQKEALADVGEELDQDLQPAPYDEEKAKAEEEKILEEQKASPNAVPVPEGVASQVDLEREARAEQIRQDPMAHLTRIERAQAMKFGMMQQPQQGANYPTPQMGAGFPMGGTDPFDQPFPDAGAGPDQAVSQQQQGAFFVVQYYGGRIRSYMFTNLDAVRGFAQNLAGTKRLFKFERLDGELPEIDGRGRPRPR